MTKVRVHSLDGDIVMTTNNEFFIAGAKGGLPVTYDRNKAPKSNLNHEEIWKSDVLTFDNKIGFLTNLGSTFYSIRENFPKDSLEYKIITNRLKVCAVQQNREIDKGKGLSIPEIPKHWTSYQRWDEDTPQEEKEMFSLYNSLLAKKRPMFMRYLYPHFDKQYKKHYDIYNTLSINQFGASLEELLAKEDKSKDEKKWSDFYFRYSHLVDSPSVVNEVSRIMISEVKEMKTVASNLSLKFEVDKDKLKSFRELYSLWKKNRVKDEDGCLAIEIRGMGYKITSNEKELARLSMSCSFAFGLSVFQQEVLEYFRKEEIIVPVLDEGGNIEFNGDSFSLQRCNLNE